jgi:hypothetical protein
MKKAYHSTSDFLAHQKYGRITGGQKAKCFSIVDPFKLTKLGQL